MDIHLVRGSHDMMLDDRAGDKLAPLKIVVLTAHVLAEGGRKASVHFVAQEWARLGHRVHFVTVGLSQLSRWTRRSRFETLPMQQRNAFVEVQPNLFAGAYLPPVHAFSTSRRFAQPFTAILFRLYASRLPAFVVRSIQQADIVVVEGGTPLAFLPLVSRLNRKAKLLYFCRDLLSTVGASSHLLRMEAEWMAQFDSVCVPSRKLGEMLPPGGRVHFVPQGIDRALFDGANASPYSESSLNVVSIGDMLFDHQATTALAKASPEVLFHLFGVTWNEDVPANVRVYGERGFAEIVPYVRHADIGLAAYRADGREEYLAESSLKLLQYSYCGLPIILPANLPVNRGNEVRYQRGDDNDWAGLIQSALQLKRDKDLRVSAMTWREGAEASLATIR